MYSFYLRRRAAEEVKNRRNQSSTFTEPLRASPDMKEYLTKFYKYIFTAQARARYKEELGRYPILKSHYDILVPKIVSYEDFWQRHDYRCDIDRIMLELKEEDSKAISNVKNQIMGIANEANKLLVGNIEEDSTSTKETRGEEKSISKAETNTPPMETKDQDFLQLSGAIVFILNDVDDDISKFVVTLGGTITTKIKYATHALWIPTSEGDYRSCKETSTAISLSIPIVDAEIWLPRMARLRSGERWSDVDCAPFLPATKEGDNVKQNPTSLRRQEEGNQKRRSLFFLGIVLSTFLAASSVWAFQPIPTMEECCRPARPGTFLELFCNQMGVTTMQKRPFWKKIKREF